MHIKANFQRESINKLCNFRNKTSTCSKTFREKTLTQALKEFWRKGHQQALKFQRKRDKDLKKCSELSEKWTSKALKFPRKSINQLHVNRHQQALRMQEKAMKKSSEISEKRHQQVQEISENCISMGGWSHTYMYMYIQANLYHLFLSHLMNITYHLCLVIVAQRLVHWFAGH